MIGAGLTAAIGALHVYILVLEMFRWEHPRTRRAFGTTEEFARATKVLAANQGLYNGFLAAGLFWAVIEGVMIDSSGGAGRPLALFFLACVLVAGLYGAATASRRILFIQAVPAALAIAAVLAGV
jgi:putative membrane protein